MSDTQSPRSSAFKPAAHGGHDWKAVHEDLENNNEVGLYGGANSTWIGMAEVRGKVDLSKVHSVRSPDEFYVPQLDALWKTERIRRRWNDLSSVDPMGMYARHPTQSATTANMEVPEIQGNLVRDGKIVNEDGSIKVIKMAVDYVWNLPALSARINMTEDELRGCIYRYTHQEAVKDTTKKTFLPPVAGFTIYFIGDPSKLADPKTETCVRVHDSCCGSDVFGTDICTCRPYLTYALEKCVECAQRGGVGVIVYFQKEGRALGEVTKFRVYNARKAQEGGDSSEKYFHQTESIAGIRDARFQQMMPDALLMIGLTKIDTLHSMSNEKYDAMIEQGIEIMERVSLPDDCIPANAHIEINAKIADGYHKGAEVVIGDMKERVVAQLRPLSAVRATTTKVFERAKKDESKFFNVNMDKLPACADFVMDVMKEAYPGGVDTIPYHSRWRHFKDGSVEKLRASWSCGDLEDVRRQLDLAFVSVLLDAGAGNQWEYICNDDKSHCRSEGLAVASFEMFENGFFSSDKALKSRVNSLGLASMDFEEFTRAFQVSRTNPMKGLKGRYELLKRLGGALDANPKFFGAECPRPGNVVDYVLSGCNDKKEVSIEHLWSAIIEGLESIWPAETQASVRRGDVWHFSPLKTEEVGSDLVAFHKLSQWLTYSLLEPMEATGIKFTDTQLMTALAEYRNGGLLVDLGVIEMKRPQLLEASFAVGSELVIEWRALTIALMDEMAVIIRKAYNATAETMPLVKILQGGTWTAGRKIAKQLRPDTCAPPITVRSEGNVF